MRLRLTIQRSKLPSADLLWLVPEAGAHRTLTVSKLLEDVNDVFPLETDHRGLDDYVVEIAGFECLHFQKVTEILKDEDQVCIRPLTSTELRARHLSGRSQINANGQHLLDGIPFGRSNLRKLDRPALHSPPDVDNDDLFAALLGNNRSHKHLRNSSGQENDSGADSDYAPGPPLRKRQRIEACDRSDKSVRFEDEEPAAADSRALVALPSDDDESEEEYVPGDDESSSSESDSDSDEEVDVGKKQVEESSDESSDDSSATSFVTDSERRHIKNKPTPSSTHVNISSDSSDTSSDSDASSESSSSEESSSDESSSDESTSESEPEELPTKRQVPAKRIVPPGQGKKQTQDRNHRRRDQTRMKQFKAKGILPLNATLADFRNWQLRNQTADGDEPEDESMVDAEYDPIQALLEEKRRKLLEALASGGLENTARPDDIIPVNRTEVETSPTIEPDKRTDDPVAKEAPSTETAAAHEEPAAKRNKLDMGSTRRLLFGALGVRNPKTKADEDKLRNRLSANMNTRQRKKAPVQQEVEEQPEPEDPDLWKKKINLIAFECKYPEVELTAPSFPFQQRWDPQFQYYQSNTKNKKRKRKSKPKQEEYYEEYDNGAYDGDASYYDEEWAGLDYDDTMQGDDANNDASTNDASTNAYAADDAALQSQIMQELQGDGAAAEPDDDLPLPPADLTTLPTASQADARPGAVLVFQRLEVSPETSWTPTLTEARTARVEEVDGSDVKFVLAKRHWKPKKEVRFDARGRRLLDKFEMDVDGEDEEEGEEGVVWVDWGELVEVRVLRAAEGGDAAAAAVAEAEPRGEQVEVAKEVQTVQTVETVEEVTEVGVDAPSSPAEDAVIEESE
ncbi:uncharacterized protein K452DRAFT_360086 [Aplosporella prunicola CBS 121167]|uniref:DUF7357 domain-containing protein n=1 Tax=Aplosporella prunicola CBS 121167 TaxID=1176127 RepID=A0A6A6B6S7_9PEZI|nr:uncharacterized protein K452DRAFT_360086 [Aplosporella prunicola CBS 121167]KAF2139842.1 hypothetical protein K452DRAFT_360086 [Aplosporella prunicola CBS 121167]